jgi:hypothetical protein
MDNIEKAFNAYIERADRFEPYYAFEAGWFAHEAHKAQEAAMYAKAAEDTKVAFAKFMAKINPTRG